MASSVYPEIGNGTDVDNSSDASEKLGTRSTPRIASSQILRLRRDSASCRPACLAHLARCGTEDVVLERHLHVLRINGTRRAGQRCAPRTLYVVVVVVRLGGVAELVVVIVLPLVVVIMVLRGRATVSKEASVASVVWADLVLLLMGFRGM